MVNETQRREDAKITAKIENDISYKIIDAVIEIHRVLGGGLLEYIYRTLYQW